MSHFHDVWTAADDWQRAFLLALVVATVAQTLFVGGLLFRRRWYRTGPGRATTIKSLSFGVILWLTLVNSFLVYPGEEQVGTVAFVLVTAAIVYQLVAFWRSPRHPAE